MQNIQKDAQYIVEFLARDFSDIKNKESIYDV